MIKKIFKQLPSSEFILQQSIKQLEIIKSPFQWKQRYLFNNETGKDSNDVKQQGKIEQKNSSINRIIEIKKSYLKKEQSSWRHLNQGFNKNQNKINDLMNQMGNDLQQISQLSTQKQNHEFILKQYLNILSRLSFLRKIKKYPILQNSKILKFNFYIFNLVNKGIKRTQYCNPYLLKRAIAGQFCGLIVGAILYPLLALISSKPYISFYSIYCCGTHLYQLFTNLQILRSFMPQNKYLNYYPFKFKFQTSNQKSIFCVKNDISQSKIVSRTLIRQLLFAFCFTFLCRYIRSQQFMPSILTATIFLLLRALSMIILF